MTTSTPVEPGVYRFAGIRYTPNGTPIETNNVVQVRPFNRWKNDLVVAYFGRSQLFPLFRFAGEWELIESAQEAA